MKAIEEEVEALDGDEKKCTCRSLPAFPVFPNFQTFISHFHRSITVNALICESLMCLKIFRQQIALPLALSSCCPCS